MNLVDGFIEFKKVVREDSIDFDFLVVQIAEVIIHTQAKTDKERMIGLVNLINDYCKWKKED